MFVDGDEFFALREGELRFREVAGVEGFALDSHRRFNRDPFDIVRGRRGMFDGADANDDASAVDREDGDVLLMGAVRHAGDEEFHRLSATSHRSRAGLELFDDASARFAFVNIHNICILQVYGLATEATPGGRMYRHDGQICPVLQELTPAPMQMDGILTSHYSYRPKFFVSDQPRRLYCLYAEAHLLLYHPIVMICGWLLSRLDYYSTHWLT